MKPNKISSPSVHIERVYTALLDPNKKYENAYQMAKENNWPNDHLIKEEIDKGLNKGEIVIKDGFLALPYNTDNPYLQAFRKIYKKDPKCLRNLMHSMRKDKHIRGLCESAMDNKTKKILEDCGIKSFS